MRPSRRSGAFTLIEVLAVVLLIGILLGVALDFYVDLSNASTRATEGTRELRRSIAILDRVAGDLERALLVRKPPETDPLSHPWVFVAESRYSESGADRVKFAASRWDTQSTDGPASDVAMIAYALRPSEDGEGYALHRWTSPQLPERLERDIPPEEDPAWRLLADGIGDFGLRFLSEDGAESREWDSSQLVDSSELPAAVEIGVSLSVAGDPLEARELLTRRVTLPVRPLDMQALLDPEAYGAETGDGGEAGEGGLTVADCVECSLVEDPQIAAICEQSSDAPFEPFRDVACGHAAVRQDCCQ